MISYNDIERDILYKHLNNAVIESQERKYTKLGYKIKKDARFGNYIADLVAVKNDEKIVIEIKIGKENRDTINRIKEIKKIINKNPIYKFLYVHIEEPQLPSIEIENLHLIITDYLINNDFPPELDSLSTHTNIEGVSDVEIDEILISKNNIFLKGGCIVEISLNFGSDDDEGTSWDDSIYLRFSFHLDNKLKITEVESLEFEDNH